MSSGVTTSLVAAGSSDAFKPSASQVMRNPLEQMIVVMITSLAHMCLVAAAKPHRTALLNFMDGFSSVMAFVVILCGLLFLSGLLQAWEERTTT